MDAVTMSDRERNTDDSGSVGSESDGQCSPIDPKNKKKTRPDTGEGEATMCKPNPRQDYKNSDPLRGKSKREKKRSDVKQFF